MKNNKGSSLILVIVCIAFAGILGATVLMASATNRDMKLVDEMAKENFYLTESGLDIFLANLSQMSEEVMGEEYTYVLTHYSADNDDVLKSRVQRSLFYELTGSSDVSEGVSAAVKRSLLEKNADGTLTGTLFYGMEPENYGVGFRLLNLEEGTPDLTAVADGRDIVLKNVSIAYMENGYETVITTDVRLAVEFTRLDVEAPVTISGSYVDYAIISDQDVRISESASTVSGNVYAGEGLAADNSGRLALAAERVVVGGQLRTERGGSIDIAGLTGNVAVWAKNILTVKDGTGATGAQSIRLRNADCYVADDMTIGAEHSEITITGNYYGYTTVGGGVTAADSSAIVINAGNSTLDLSGLGMLWLAGRSSVRVPDVYGSDASGGVSYREIMEGETISYKGNQLAYLVPGECIKGYEHNPLTQAEYNAIAADGGIAGYIDTGARFGADGTMTLAPYAAANPCEVVPVRFLSESEPLYYVYIRFKSSAAAEEYFLKYSEVNRSVLDAYSEVLMLGEVKLPSAAGAVKTNGTVLKVNEKHQITDVIAGTISQTEAFERQSDLKRRFSGLLAMLDENYNGIAGESLVRNIVRMSELPAGEVRLYFDRDMKKQGEAASDGYQVIVKRGDVTLREAADFKGIIIADGNITLEGGSFSGMLLATGDITLRSVSVSGGSSFLKELIDKNTSIQRYFMNYPLPSEEGGGGETANARNISVTVENWIKN